MELHGSWNFRKLATSQAKPLPYKDTARRDLSQVNLPAELNQFMVELAVSRILIHLCVKFECHELIRLQMSQCIASH